MDANKPGTRKRQEFTDSQGNLWHLIADYAAGRRVREATGLDLFNLTRPDTEDHKQFTQDHFKLFDAIVAVLRPEMDRRGVSADDLATAVNSEEIAEAAGLAIFEAVANFTQPGSRDLILGTLEKTMDITNQMRQENSQKVREALDSGELDSVLAEAIRGTPGTPG